MTERDSEIGKSNQANPVSQAAQRPNQQIITAFANILQKYGSSKNQNQNNKMSNRIVIDDQNQEGINEEDHNKTPQFNVSNKEEKQDKNKNKDVFQEEEQVRVTQKLSYSPEKASLNKQLCKKSTKGPSKKISAEQKTSVQSIQPQEKIVEKMQDVTENVQVITSSPQQNIHEDQVLEFVQQVQFNANEPKSKQNANAKKQTKPKQTKTKPKPKPAKQFSEVKPIIEIEQDITIQQELLKLQTKDSKNQKDTKQMTHVKFVVEVQLLPGEPTSKTVNKIDKFQAAGFLNQQNNKKIVSQATKNNSQKDKNLTQYNVFKKDIFLNKQLQNDKDSNQNKVQKKRFIQQQQVKKSEVVPKSSNQVAPKSLNQVASKSLNQVVSKPLNEVVSKPQNKINKNQVQIKSKVAQNETITKKDMSFMVPKTDKMSINVRVDRFKARDEPINIGSASLSDLVKYLLEKKIINEALSNEFLDHHSITDIKDFLSKFQSGKLHKFDFDKFKFTILDHRRLAELLTTLYPDNYFIGNCHHADTSVLDFLTNLYDLTAEEYFNLYTKIDKISGIKWWSKILIAQDERLMETSKQRRIAKRKADQAAQAVKQVVSNAQKQLQKASTGSILNAQNEEDQLDSPDQKKQTAVNREKEKQKRRQQQQEVEKIRKMVASNFGSKKGERLAKMQDQSMRKKIKFY